MKFFNRFKKALSTISLAAFLSTVTPAIKAEENYNFDYSEPTLQSTPLPIAKVLTDEEIEKNPRLNEI